MKTIFNIIFLFILVAGLASAIEVNTTGNLIGSNSIVFQSLRYNPYPVTPGDYFEIWFRVINNGNSDLSNVKFSITETFPFSVYPGESKEQTFSSLAKGAEVNFKFKIKVDDKAVEKDESLKVLVNDGQTSREFPITIRSRSPTLSIISVSTQPERIQQGEKSKIIIKLKNDASTIMRNINAKLDISSTIFSPVYSVTEKNIRTLSPGEEATLEYDIIADPDADSKPYNIPFKLTYYDVLDNKLTSNETIGVIVESMPKIEILFEESKVYTKGDNGDIIVSVSNVGPTKVKFLTIELNPAKSYDILTASKIYLGDLEPDDFQTATFKIKTNSKDVNLNMSINYKNSLNEEFNKNTNIKVPIFSSSEAVSYGFKTAKTNIFSIIFYFLALMFVYYAYKEYRIHKELPISLKIALKRTLRIIIRFIGFFRPSNLRSLPYRIRRWMRDDKWLYFFNNKQHPS